MRSILVIAALTAAQLALAPTASADDVVKVPRNGKVKITGHGYGHGHGMSQYGAQGAARQGKSYRQILRYYYPGTSLHRIHPNIRVLLTADTTTSVTVLARRDLVVRDVADGKRFKLPNLRHSNRWRLVPATQDRRLTKIQFKRRGTWHRWELPGRTLFKGDAEFLGGPKTLVMPGGAGKVYRGRLRSASPSRSSHRRDTVNVITMELYVQGVIASEMPSSWRQAALRSQAIAARTYAAHQRRSHRSHYYQICDTTACQVYGGRAAEASSTNRAVRATRNLILRYGGRAAFTQFSSSSGGWTSSGGYRYLPTKQDRYDGWSGNPVHTWTTAVPTKRIERAYHLGNLNGVRVISRDGHGSWGGRVVRVWLDGSKRNEKISGNTMRARFGLRSNWFRFG